MMQSYNINQIEYSLLDNFNLIILDELKSIPNILATRLQEYISTGHTLYIFPNENAQGAPIISFSKLCCRLSSKLDYVEEIQVEFINYLTCYFSIFTVGRKIDNSTKMLQGSFLITQKYIFSI